MVWMINESSPRRKVLTDSVAEIIVPFLLQQKSVYTTAAFFLLGWWPNRRRPLSRAVRGYLCLLWWERASFSSAELREEWVGLRVHLVGNILEMWDDAWQGSWVTLKKTGEVSLLFPVCNVITACHRMRSSDVPSHRPHWLPFSAEVKVGS